MAHSGSPGSLPDWSPGLRPTSSPHCGSLQDRLQVGLRAHLLGTQPYSADRANSLSQCGMGYGSLAVSSNLTPAWSRTCYSDYLSRVLVKALITFSMRTFRIHKSVETTKMLNNEAGKVNKPIRMDLKIATIFSMRYIMCLEILLCLLLFECSPYLFNSTQNLLIRDTI